MASLTLSEFDDYVKNIFRNKKISPFVFKYYKDLNISDVYCEVDKDTFDIILDCKTNESGVVKTNKLIKYKGNWNVYNINNLNVVDNLVKKEEDIFKNLPKLCINKQDIKYISIYLTNKSYHREFYKDFERISIIEQNTNVNTLCIMLLPNKTFKLVLNPDFIARTIVSDYLCHYYNVVGYENYGGAKSTFAYLIGHELLHYRNNHFSLLVNKSIKNIFNNNLNVVNEKNKNVINSILDKKVIFLKEIQNNVRMSNILDMGVSDSGIGRLSMNNNNFVELFGGIIKFNDDFYEDDKRYKFSFVIKYKKLGIKEYFDTLNKESSFIYPFFNKIPLDEDLFEAITLYILGSSKNEVNPTNQLEIDGYLVGDRVVVKGGVKVWGGKRGTVVNVEGDDVFIELDERSIIEEIGDYIKAIDDNFICIKKLKELGLNDKVVDDIVYKNKFDLLSEQDRIFVRDLLKDIYNNLRGLS